ncbi:heavy metal translocating P-type ATPase [Congzhengia minquanensis]|uniref:Cd(2+)-exporting ATPase n=1 Tax=Congzhengia minquanensis TaxID=2763657 RepID=A0A926DR07_9FIRM|nr:heavy metal translocating P-type ATPase [Congzhengia minquanensis]MBC8541725.1 cadmium-translocating P-type ATPase [Congzhengia minquanensis]
MTKKQKRLLGKIIIALALFIPSLFVQNVPVKFALTALAFFVCGGEVVLRAAKNIARGNMLDENFLMSIATIGAFCIGEFSEGAAVIMFYQVGELFQSLAVSKSRKSISDLMDICPEHANVLREGEFVSVDPSEVLVGDMILIKPGEKIPVDCCVIEGQSDIDTRAITGETALAPAGEGDKLISGSVNLNGVLKARALCEFQNSAVSKILELVEATSERKSQYESFIHRFAVIYTPVVVACAVLLAIVPPVLGGGFTMWLARALTFLVVSCPCALVISVPLSFFGGLGRASSMGILIKGSNYLEALKKCRAIVFDKTGTLTSGGFFVTEVNPEVTQKEALLKIAASAESFSNHPVSAAVKEAYAGELLQAEDVAELAGRGVSAKINGKQVLAGNKKLMEEYKIEYKESSAVGTVIYVAQDGQFLGSIAVADKVKDNAKELIQRLNDLGIHKTVMLTGDRENAAKAAAEEIGISEYHAELLPQDKVALMSKIISETNGKVIFVGDGINDAPVLAMADVAISMGALGSDAAIEASDIVLTDDNLMKIPAAIKLAGKTVAIVKQNVVLAIGVKFAVLILSAFGFANMWAAVFADVGVAVIAILNAMRIMNKRLTKL